MRFLIFSEDKPNSLDIRKAARDAHLAFLKADTSATVLMAGPWLDASGNMAGSLLVVESESRETLDGWMSRDPYTAAGLPGQVTVKPFIWAVGAPE